MTDEEKTAVDATRATYGLLPIYGEPRPCTPEEVERLQSADVEGYEAWIVDGFVQWRRPVQ